MNDGRATGRDEDAEIGLPASIEAAWGIRERPRKGPKPGLSLRRIVVAAMNVAERDGLAAVSMNRVASELGASTMSLYRYVAAKEELLMLMADTAYGPPPLARRPGEDWRAGLSRWAWESIQPMRKHPWALKVPISGPPVTPNVVAWLEQGLQCLADTGLVESEKMSVILLVSGYVRNNASVDADIAEAVRMTGSTEQQIMPGYGRLLAALTDPEHFPALHAVLASDVFDVDDDPDDEFNFGLERILDGIEVLVRERTDTPALD